MTLQIIRVTDIPLRQSFLKNLCRSLAVPGALISSLVNSTSPRECWEFRKDSLGVMESFLNVCNVQNDRSSALCEISGNSTTNIIPVDRELIKTIANGIDVNLIMGQEEDINTMSSKKYKSIRKWRPVGTGKNLEINGYFCF